MSWMPYLNMASRSIPMPKAQPVHFAGSKPPERRTSRVNHAAAEHLHPAALLADAAALAVAEDATEGYLGARFGKRKKTGMEAAADVLAEKPLAEIVENPLEVGESDVLVDGEALDLMEDGRVRGVGIVAPVDLAGDDDVEGGSLYFSMARICTGEVCVRRTVFAST